MVLALERVRRLLPGLWAGLLIGVGALAAPALFASLPAMQAGQVVARILATEAATSLALGATLLILERRRAAAAASADGSSQFNLETALVLAALFCTIFGYYAIVPQMAAARAGLGAISFAALHLISSSLFVAKGLLVLTLAWRATRTAGPA
jgi:hypothetical protein